LGCTGALEPLPGVAESALAGLVAEEPGVAALPELLPGVVAEALPEPLPCVAEGELPFDPVLELPEPEVFPPVLTLPLAPAPVPAPAPFPLAPAPPLACPPAPAPPVDCANPGEKVRTVARDRILK
jgi:hypothetical protein